MTLIVGLFNSLLDRIFVNFHTISRITERRQSFATKIIGILHRFEGRQKNGSLVSPTIKLIKHLLSGSLR